MPRIVVKPEALRAFSAQFQQAAGDLRAVSGRVGGALGSLDWEARQKAGVDGQVNDARGRANALAEQAEALARYLATKAQTFEEADGQGAAGLPTTPHLPFPLPAPAPPRLPWPFPTLPSPTLPTRAELERLLKTLLALKPLLLELLLKRLGLDTIKDVLDLTQTENYMKEMDRARDAWAEARIKYGEDSPQAAAAREGYYDMYEHMPILGTYIKVLLDMGRANPVE